MIHFLVEGFVRKATCRRRSFTTAGTVVFKRTILYSPAIAGTMSTVSTVFGTKIRFVFSVTFLVTGARIFGFAFFGFCFLSFPWRFLFIGVFVTLDGFTRFNQTSFRFERRYVAI